MNKNIIMNFENFVNGDDSENISEESKGLWYNIMAKRKRGEKPLKKGDKNYPKKKQWDKLSTEENEETIRGGNYMFWQNIKNIQHCCNEILNMDKAEIDKILENGHAWAIDHVSTSCDDIEEVYHFIESNKEEDTDNKFNESKN